MEEEIRRVLYNYNLGKLQDACQIKCGFVNKNWIIQTTQGRYFLKRRHPGLRNPDIVGLQKMSYRPSEAVEALMEVLALGNWSAANRQRMIETVRRAIGRTSKF